MESHCTPGPLADRLHCLCRGAGSPVSMLAASSAMCVEVGT